MKNQVKQGYKQTEVGVIPEDWEVKSLDQIAHIERGKFTARPRNDPKYYGGNIPFIQTGDVSNSNGTIKSFSQTLNEAGLRVSKKFPIGTIFFTIAANIGDVAFADFETACPDSLVAIKTYQDINAKWLSQELSQRKKAFENLATHNAQLNINLEKIRPYQILVPPIAEQEKIAEALSDVDSLIESLEEAIAKKRHIKQGAMQELLTGKRRLSGFEQNAVYKQTEMGLIPEDWDIYPLQSVIYDLRGGAPLKPSDFTQRGIKVLPKGGITWGGALKISEKNQQYCSISYSEKYIKNTVDETYTVVTLRDLVPSGPSIGLIVKITQPAFYVLAQGVYGFKVNSDFCRDYLIQYSNSHPYRRLMNEIMVGSTQVHVTNTAFKNVKLPYPPKAEQEAIAEVLTDMDNEITALEEKLNKTRQIKQGMMQELLTGKTRLI